MHSKIIRSLLGLFALALTLHLHAEILLGRVIHIADGDTITVLDAKKNQHRVRLTGIDAAEKNQVFGDASKKSLSEPIADKNVNIHWDNQDKYSRKLGKVTLGELDCNLEQLRRGFAWHYKYYEGEQPPVDRKSYANAEKVARSKKISLWRDLEPTPPWEFRKTQRDSTS